MDHSDKQDPRTSRIEEDDIHAEDVKRRSFFRIGLFAAAGLAGLTMGCGSDSADQDTGDQIGFDLDSTDSVQLDRDTGDTADTDS